jgi:hypothetical protein
LADEAIGTREGDSGGSIGAGDVVVCCGYWSGERAVLEQARGTSREIQSPALTIGVLEE